MLHKILAVKWYVRYLTKNVRIRFVKGFLSVNFFSSNLPYLSLGLFNCFSYSTIISIYNLNKDKINLSQFNICRPMPIF